jgi:hypothetical protein
MKFLPKKIFFDLRAIFFGRNSKYDLKVLFKFLNTILNILFKNLSPTLRVDSKDASPIKPPMIDEVVRSGTNGLVPNMPNMVDHYPSQFIIMHPIVK